MKASVGLGVGGGCGGAAALRQHWTLLPPGQRPVLKIPPVHGVVDLSRQFPGVAPSLQEATMQHFTSVGSLGQAPVTVKPFVQLEEALQVPLPWGARQTEPMAAREGARREKVRRSWGIIVRGGNWKLNVYSSQTDGVRLWC